MHGLIGRLVGRTRKIVAWPASTELHHGGGEQLENATIYELLMIGGHRSMDKIGI